MATATKEAPSAPKSKKQADKYAEHIDKIWTRLLAAEGLGDKIIEDVQELQSKVSKIEGRLGLD